MHAFLTRNANVNTNRSNRRARSAQSPQMRAQIASLALALPALAGLAASVSAADLPVRSVTLYRSGVGYFEHTGTVQDSETVALRFDAERVNDVLKSMILLDLSGGRIDSVNYASKAPLARRLASFGVNIADNPSLAELLGRLRGAGIKVATPEGPLTGVIMGVENRAVPAGAGDAVVTQPFLSLVTDSGIRAVAIPSITTFDLQDKELAKELSQALAALAEARTERTASVDLAFSGAGKRQVVVGYVHEAAVWKTTYRLVLPDETNADPTLQGWAIVENTTDQDWKDVRLSLAAGRPVSFIMDLHQPLFVPRPVVPVPYMTALAPRMYENEMTLGDVAAPAPEEALRDSELRRQRLGGRAAMGGVAGDALMSKAEADSVAGGWQANSDDLIRYAAAAQASGGEIGEQFQFTIDAPVTIERQRSAMVPIIGAPVEGRRVSIYNAAEQPRHPMRGVEMTNNTEMTLIAGPISVYDGGAYAGDAQIDHTSRGQERLLSYAVDLDVQSSSETKNASNLLKIRIVDGLVEMQSKNRQTTTYTFKNNDQSRPRTVLIEHPRQLGWDLVAPKEPKSKTDSFLRFEASVDPNGAKSLDVVTEMTNYQRYAMTSMDLPTLLSYSSQGKASKAVVDAVKKAAEMQSKINSLERAIADLDRERDEITRDQSRIRDNMGRIAGNSELYGRYMKKLNEQEARLEEILTRRDAASGEVDQAKAALNLYLRDLDVE